jgi:hypothetical protein
LEDLGVDGRIIFKWALKIGCEIVDWMHLAPDRTLVNTILEIHVQKKAMNFLTG